MDVNSFIKLLGEKYKYSEELTQVLSLIVPNIIQYYGKENENLILNTLAVCPIYITTLGINVNKLINDYFPEKENKKIPLLAGAFYESVPIIEGENITPKRLICIATNTTITNEKNISNLIHELCHAIKSYNNEYTVFNNNIIQRSGLSYSQISNNETGKIITVQEKGVGLEEGINAFDETCIMSLTYDRPYQNNGILGYGALTDLAQMMAQNPNLAMCMKNDTLYGTTSLKETFGEENYEMLLQKADMIIKTSYLSGKEVTDKEYRKKVFGESDQAYLEIENMINNYNLSINTNHTL